MDPKLPPVQGIPFTRSSLDSYRFCSLARPITRTGNWDSEENKLSHNLALGGVVSESPNLASFCTFGQSRNFRHEEGRTNGCVNGCSFSTRATFVNHAMCTVLTGSEYLSGACSPMCILGSHRADGIQLRTITSKPLF